MNRTAIEVNNVCIDYKDINKMSLHQLFFNKEIKKSNIVHAVKDVSFTVERGEIIGIIGRNGSGKSTLLRSIGGIFQPDSGTIDLKGNRVALMAIGVGFKGDNSGRENIYRSGMLLGCDENYIKERIDEIIDFSELGEFIDRPVRTYSSGMYSKLSFAVTAILETEIMLIDEVLSVGDEHFRKKSYKKMEELMSNDDRTVLIVSHDINTLKRICGKAIWLHDGCLMQYDHTEKVLVDYQKFMGE